MMRNLAAIALLLLSKAAAACSCPSAEPAGFVHADVKHLPLNARGALFLTPYGDPPPSPAASDFSITSDRDAKPLKVALSYPDIGAPNSPLRQQRLVRVGPADGFKAGWHYTIRYVGKADKWFYPLTVDFTIDAAPVDLRTLSYQLVPDGPPQRQLMSLADGRGTCASSQPVIAQNFHYVLPSSLEPYRQAIAYFSEARIGGSYAGIVFHHSVCEDPVFARTAYGDGHDAFQTSCEKPDNASAIRGRAAFLEVEDRLQTTAPVNINPHQAAGRSCTGLGIIKDALAVQDYRRALTTACGIDNERPYDDIFIPYAREKPGKVLQRDLPTKEALTQLAKNASADEQQCVNNVIQKVAALRR